MELEDLCNKLISKGVPKKEILRISRESDVSIFTIPGTDNYEYADIAKFFSSLIIGAALGTYIGYRASQNLSGAIFGGLLGGIIGELGCFGMQCDHYDCEREMLGSLKRKYSVLLKENPEKI